MQIRTKIQTSSCILFCMFLIHCSCGGNNPSGDGQEQPDFIIYEEEIIINDDFNGDGNGDEDQQTDLPYPFADAGSDHTIGFGKLIHLHADQSVEQNYQWECTYHEGSSLYLEQQFSAHAVAIAPTQKDIVTCNLTTSNQYGTDSDQIIITVTNSPPILGLNAAWNANLHHYEITSPSSQDVTLDASQSWDPDGHTISFLWESTDYTFSSEQMTLPLITMQAPPIDGNTYMIHMAISDGFTDTSPVAIAVIAENIDTCIYVDDDAATSLEDPTGTLSQPYPTITAALMDKQTEQHIHLCLLRGVYTNLPTLGNTITITGDYTSDGLRGSNSQTTQLLVSSHLLIEPGSQVTLDTLTIKPDSQASLENTIHIIDAAFVANNCEIHGPSDRDHGTGILIEAKALPTTAAIMNSPHIDGGSSNIQSTGVLAENYSTQPLHLYLFNNTSIWGTASFRLPGFGDDADEYAAGILTIGNVTATIEKNNSIRGGRSKESTAIACQSSHMHIGGNNEIQSWPNMVDYSSDLYHRGSGITGSYCHLTINDNTFISSGQLPMAYGEAIALQACTGFISNNSEIRGTTGAHDNHLTPFFTDDAIKGYQNIAILLDHCYHLDIANNLQIIADDCEFYSAAISDGYPDGSSVSLGNSSFINIHDNVLIASDKRNTIHGEDAPWPWVATGIGLFGTQQSSITNNPPTSPIEFNGIRGGTGAVTPALLNPLPYRPSNPFAPGIWVHAVDHVDIEQNIIWSGSFDLSPLSTETPLYTSLIIDDLGANQNSTNVNIERNTILSGGVDASISTAPTKDIVIDHCQDCSLQNNIISTLFGADLVGLECNYSSLDVTHNTIHLDFYSENTDAQPPLNRQALVFDHCEAQLHNNLIYVGNNPPSLNEHIILYGSYPETNTSIINFAGNLLWLDGDSLGSAVPPIYLIYNGLTLQEFTREEINALPIQNGTATGNFADQPGIVYSGFYYEKWLLDLLPTSAAINHGLPQYSTVQDYHGDARTDIAPDCGAVEY